MTGRSLNIALIGAGGIGGRWGKVIKGVGGVSLRAVVDTDSDRAKAVSCQHRRCKALTNWKTLLTEKEIDAVIIATPHNLLFPISLAFLKSKKHVLCEKPGALMSNQIRQNIFAARKNRLVYMIGFNHRFHEAFIKASKFLKNGKIGEIIFIRARYGFGGRREYAEEWRHNKKVSGGGELIDQGVHMIDLVRLFLGGVQDVCGFAEDTFWKSGVDDNAFLILKNKKNMIASIHVSWTQWKPLHNFEIYGTDGYLIIEGLGRKYGGKEKLIIGIRSKNFSGKPKERTVECNPEADNSLARELKEFVTAIRENRQPVPSGRDGYETLRIVEKIYKTY